MSTELLKRQYFYVVQLMFDVIRSWFSISKATKILLDKYLVSSDSLS